MNTTTMTFDGRFKLVPRRLVLSFVIALLATGCASSPPTIGDNIALERDQYGQISEKWADGEKLVSRGNKKIKKGKKQVRDGESNISEGEDMVRRGERMMRDSQREFELKKTTGI